MDSKGKVYYAGSLAGIVSETDEGYEFKYDKKYLESENAKPVSLTLPLAKTVFTSKVLFSFFDGLIPEGWLLDIATNHWKIKANDRFKLLLYTCRDAIGAVSITPEKE